MAGSVKIDTRLGWGLVHAALVDDEAGLADVVDTLDLDEARTLVLVFAEVIAGILPCGTAPERCAEELRGLLRQPVTESDR